MKLQYLSGHKQRTALEQRWIMKNQGYVCNTLTVLRQFLLLLLEHAFTNIYVRYVQPRLCSSPLSSLFHTPDFLLFSHLISPPRHSAQGRAEHSSLVSETWGVWSSEPKSRQLSSLCFGNPWACLCVRPRVRLHSSVLLSEAKKRNNMRLQLWLINHDKIKSVCYMNIFLPSCALKLKTLFLTKALIQKWVSKSSFCVFCCCS